MAETTLNLSTEEAYARLKEQLGRRKCSVFGEKGPSRISANQGSLWGTTPKTAQKTMTFTLQEDASGTKVTCKSNLTPAYVTLTVAGIVFSVALMIICLSMALDLQAYASTGYTGFWGWLVQTQGSFNPDKAALLTRLSWFLAAFLAATLMVETAVVVRVKIRINAIAEEIFRTLALQK